MNINEMFPKKWLSPLDIPAGKSVAVYIESVTVEQVRNPRANRVEPKLIVAFHGKQKRLILNKTQAYAIAHATGAMETDAWPGHSVTITVGMAPNNQPTIVITPAAQRTDPAPAADDNPFEDGAPE